MALIRVHWPAAFGVKTVLINESHFDASLHTVTDALEVEDGGTGTSINSEDGQGQQQHSELSAEGQRDDADVNESHDGQGREEGQVSQEQLKEEAKPEATPAPKPQLKGRRGRNRR